MVEVDEICTGYFVAWATLSASMERYQGHRILLDGPLAVFAEC
jgi:hypothetical protein